MPEGDKARKVAEVFHSVAQRYDIMNDFMSAGLHRVWKAFTIGRAAIRPGMKVLDIAGGTGDGARFAKRAGPDGEVWLTDINDSMLRVGRDRRPTPARSSRPPSATPSACRSPPAISTASAWPSACAT